MTTIPPGTARAALLQTLRWLARPIPMLEDCRPPLRRRVHDPALGVPTARPLQPSRRRSKRSSPAIPTSSTPARPTRSSRPFVGTRSVLLLDGAAHLRQRRLLMPPFHGERMQRLRRAHARDHRARDRRAGRSAARSRSTPRCSASRSTSSCAPCSASRKARQLDALRAAHGRACATPSSTRSSDAACSRRCQRDLGPLTPWGAFDAHPRRGRSHALRRDRARGAPRPRADRTDVLALLLDARDEDGAADDRPGAARRDGDAALAGHETTATTLAWALDVRARASRRVRAHARRVAALDDPERAPGDRRPRLPRRDHQGDAAPHADHPDGRPPPASADDDRRLRAAAGVVVGAVDLPHPPPARSLGPDPTRSAPSASSASSPRPTSSSRSAAASARCLGMAFATLRDEDRARPILRRAELRAAPGYRARSCAAGLAFAPSEGMPVVVERRAA